MKLTVRKDIAALRRDAVNRINELCGQVRARFVNDHSGAGHDLSGEGERRPPLPGRISRPRRASPPRSTPIRAWAFRSPISREVGITAATGFEVAMFYVQGAAQS